MDKIDISFILFMTIVLVVGAIGIGDVTWHHYQTQHVEKEIQSKREGWEPPVIPSCDEELWDRIKDRCGDQLDEGED